MEDTVELKSEKEMGFKDIVESDKLDGKPKPDERPQQMHDFSYFIFFLSFNLWLLTIVGAWEFLTMAKGPNVGI